MDINAYLKRLEFSHPLNPDRTCLERLIEAQLAAIPFENLDQQMGVNVTTALGPVFEKIVHRRRGGWCFELNGLFAWLLREIGFEVSMLAGHVGPDRPGADHTGDHMALRVECGGPLLVDVGFGGGPNAPIPLRPGTLSLPPYSVSLRDEGNGWYKYSEVADGAEGAYWFTLDKVETGHFDPANHRLQTDPNSPFRRTLTAQRRFRHTHMVLRGRVLKILDESGVGTKQLADDAALVDCLARDFDLDVPEVSACWPVLQQRHDQRFGN